MVKLSQKKKGGTVSIPQTNNDQVLKVGVDGNEGGGKKDLQKKRSVKKSFKGKKTAETSSNGVQLLKKAMINSKAKRSKTLLVASRNQTSHSRYLMKNIYESLVPNIKRESKIDPNHDLSEITEMCSMNACTQGAYFKVVKGREYYLWIFTANNGPSIKFQLLNIHTIEEMKTLGNALQFSRPVLSFSSEFNDKECPERLLIARMLSRLFSVPMYDQRAKPFCDRSYHFSWKGRNVVHFRHYQISPFSDADENDPNRLELTEIGPRFDLQPVAIFTNCMYGSTIWRNAKYLSPVALRKAQAMPYVVRKKESIRKREDFELRRLDIDNDSSDD